MLRGAIGRCFRANVRSLRLSGARFSTDIPKFSDSLSVNFLKQRTPLASNFRFFAHKPPHTIKSVEERITLVLSLYDKIDPKNLTMDSDFSKDLGLDSLDHVEIIMAMEEEFGFEIPDGYAEQLKTPRHVLQYICDKEDVYE